MDKKTEEYGQIDKKILELEEMQEKLIEENNTLKSKLSTQSKPIKENDDLSVFLHVKHLFNNFLNFYRARILAHKCS